MCIALTSVPGIVSLRKELGDLERERRLYLQIKRASRGLPPVLVGLRAEWSEAWRFNWIVHGQARAGHAYTLERFIGVIDNYATSETDYVFWFLGSQRRTDIEPLTPRYRRSRVSLGERRFNTLWPRRAAPTQ